MAFDFESVFDRRGSDSSKWHRHGPDVLPMYVADMDFRSPPAVIEALRRRVEHGFFGYGYAHEEFHEVFCARLAERYGWRVEPEALVPLPGVIAGFNLAARALTVPGDGLLVQTPGYPPILRCAANHGLARHDAPLRPREDGSYAIDWDAFSDAIRPETRALLLCNPHNPVGRLFTPEEVGRMAESALQHDLWVISDEIHCDIVFDGRQHTPIASLGPEIEARTVTLMAPSKTYNLAGLKASVAIIPNAELRERFEAGRAGLVPTVNVLGYTAMVAAYREGQPWLDELLTYLQANRDFLVDYVAEHLPGVSTVAPEATYLAWLDCRGAGLPDDDPQAFFLERARVALSNGADFGPGAEGFTRLCFGTPRAVLEEGLERMRQALRGR